MTLNAKRAWRQQKKVLIMNIKCVHFCILKSFIWRTVFGKKKKKISGVIIIGVKASSSVEGDSKSAVDEAKGI